MRSGAISMTHLIALQAQRTRRNPRKNIWEELDQQRTVRDAPDIEALLQQRAAVSALFEYTTSHQICAVNLPSASANQRASSSECMVMDASN